MANPEEAIYGEIPKCFFFVINSRWRYYINAWKEDGKSQNQVYKRPLKDPYAACLPKLES